MRRAPALHTHATVDGVSGVEIVKVVTRDEAELGLYPCERLLIWDEPASDRFAGTLVASGRRSGGRISVSGIRDPSVVQPGDVIRLREDGSLISVLYRRGATANSLFATERCNSMCLMCSQPPRNEDDSWRLRELLQTVELVDLDEPQLGITGGEPTLLGDGLAQLLSACRSRLPNTRLHVLTNGRTFANADLSRRLVSAGGDQTVWAIPLYADVATVHDEIVAAPNAFDETIEGLFQLARLKARVEIRIVLHALSVPRLGQLASYIYRRLPFVEHVAFMGLEPMGFAKLNRDRLWIDPADYQEALADAIHHSDVRGMNASIYNLPFCVLGKDLWPFARQSISDWKNVHDGACTACSVRESCAGFFLSAGPTWRSRSVAPIPYEEVPHEMA